MKNIVKDIRFRVKELRSDDKPTLNSHHGHEFNCVLEGSLMFHIHE